MEGKRTLTVEEALSLLADGDDAVHTFMGTEGMLIGMDWRRSTVLRRVTESVHREIAGPTMRGFDHGLAVQCEEDGPIVFIETDRAKLDAFDPPA